jgi:hypothetical protein
MVALSQPSAPEPKSNPSGLVPSRSVLYPLRPIGLGTGLVESLRSLFCRLAAAHCVTALNLWRFINSYHDLGGNPASPTISLKGSRASDIADVLSALTAIPGAHRTTLNSAQVNARICIRVRKERAWCPLCLIADKVPYDRLLWDIGINRHCPIHLIPLQSRCPTCGRLQRLASPGPDLRQCSYCGADLTTGTTLTRFPKADPFENWTTVQTSQLLQHFDFRVGDHVSSVENWTRAIHALGGFRPAAHALHIGIGSLHAWSAGEAAPGLEGVLKLSWAMQSPVVELLSKPVAEFVARGQILPWRPRTRRKTAATEEAYLCALAGFLLRHPFEVPSSLLLQRLVGGSHRHPELNKPSILRAFHIARARRRLLRRRHAVWSIVCRMHRAYRACLENKRALSIRNFSAFGAVTRKPIAKRYFLSLRQQHAAGRQAPNPHDRLPPDVVRYWTHLGLM